MKVGAGVGLGILLAVEVLVALVVVIWSVSSREFASTAWPILGLVVLLAIVTALARRSALRTADLADELEYLESTRDALLARHRSAIDALAEGLKSAIFVCDPKAVLLFANRRAQDWFRFAEPTGRSIVAVTLSYELEGLVREAARSSEPLEKELAFAFPEDRIALARAWAEPDGDRVFVSLYDLTELRRLERVRQDFVANVSHELRTPLAAIRSLAETLNDEPKADLKKRTNYLSRIMDEIDRLASIVSDLLELSRAESGPVLRQSCCISEIIEETVELLRAKAKAKGLQFESNIAQDIEMVANPGQMSQVAINLIDNAINYTPAGRVQVDLSREGGNAKLVVSDTGVGIPSEDLARIFERFFRVDKGRSRATGGTGLGLSIVRHIVEAHGGTVAAESVYKVGSTFTVLLPVSPP